MSVVRIQGVPLESKKHIVIALRAVYGIGATRAKELCKKCEIPENMKVLELAKPENEKMVIRLQEAAAEYVLEGDLRREVAMRIKQLRDSNCYRGLRHKFGLPVRGQRTRTNARTRKGKRGKVVAGKK